MLNDISKMAAHQLASAVKCGQISREDVVAARHHNTVRAMDRIIREVKEMEEADEQAKREYEANTTKEERLRDCINLIAR
jgi:phosphopantothenate synthetase